MSRKCRTCPFGPKGNPSIRISIMKQLLTSLQKCLKTRAETRLCRGARDEQLRIMHQLGVIKEETDQAWEEAYEKLSTKRNPK